MISEPSPPSLFVFHLDEKVDEGFFRLLQEMALEAHRLKKPSCETSSESTHRTRVLIKRLRALVWFASPAFSSTELLQTKSRLQRASHLLAAQRDLVVMRTTLEKLSRKTSDPGFRKKLVQLTHAHDSGAANIGLPERSLQQAVAMLLTTIKNLQRKAQSRTRWPSAAARLAKALRSMTRAGKKALRGEDPARFHEWRKRTKRLLYQLQFTQTAPGKRMAQTIHLVDELQEKLGAYHDGVIAQERMREVLPERLPPKLLRHSVKLLKNDRNCLRRDARKLFRQIKSI